MVLQHQFFGDELLVLGVSKGEGISRKSNPRLGPRSSEINCASAICNLSSCASPAARKPPQRGLHEVSGRFFEVNECPSDIDFGHLSW